MPGPRVSPWVRPSAVMGTEPDLNYFFDIYKASSPYTSFEYVDVTFAGANTDYDVVHHLSPPIPESIDYQVVRKSQACDVYNDTSGTRRPWGSGYITLRCTVANAVVTLLLTVRRT